MIHALINFLKEFNEQFYSDSVAQLSEQQERIHLLEKTLVLTGQNFEYARAERDECKQKYETLKESFVNITKKNINLIDELDETQDALQGCRNRADSYEESLHAVQGKLTVALVEIEALKQEIDSLHYDHDTACLEYKELVDSLRLEIATLKSVRVASPFAQRATPEANGEKVEAIRE